MSSTYAADVAVSLRCSNPVTSEITNALNNFIGKVSGGLDGAISLAQEIDSTVAIIADSAMGFTNQMSDLLQDKLVSFISTGLSGVSSFLFSQISSPIAALAQIKAFSASAVLPIDKLFNVFGCLNVNVKAALNFSLKDMLTNIVKNGILNPIQCAVEDFVGGILNKVINVMDSIVGPLINPINNLFSKIGQGFGSVKNVLAGGLNILNKVSGILNCVNGGGGKCHVQNTYELNKGSKPQPQLAGVQNFITKSFDKATKAVTDIGTSIENLEDDIGKFKIFGSEVEDKEQLECNSGNIFKCGLPKVEIYGGNGSGAVAEAIMGNIVENVNLEVGGIDELTEEVNKVGSIIGVDITYPGEGYTEEPLIRLVDNCDQGYGAYARAVIDKDPNSPTFGQLTDIIMISEGVNYPAEESVEVYVDKVIVENGGIGYKMDDKIQDFEICGLDENGSITEVCPSEKAYLTLPVLNIETTTGTGAILTPIMSKVRRDQATVQQIDCISPKSDFVGYVDGKPYSGDFHVMPNGNKMTGKTHSDNDRIIYNTPEESLRTLRSFTTPSTKLTDPSTRTTDTTTTSTPSYSDPSDDAMDSGGDMTPPPSSPPPSSPPSSPPSGGGGYGGY
jgi:hypothetical protein